MTITDDHRFAAAIMALAVATRTEVDEPTIEIYSRALHDIPMDLLEIAVVEMSREMKFFPKPAEWREYVDKVLDRNERNRRALASQLALPGEVAIGGEWSCAYCENTGWQTFVDGVCSHSERCDLSIRAIRHSHPCADQFCLLRRRREAEKKRRYGKKED